MWLRRVDELLQQAEFFMPNELPRGWAFHYSRQQHDRNDERRGDFKAIAERALALRDAIETLR